MSFVTDFDASLADLHQMMADLTRLEKAVSPGGNLHKQLSAISVMRSSTFIVAYNAIERSLRYALREVRQALIVKQVPYQEVEVFWRRDALRHCLHEILRQGARHDTIYEKVDEFFASVQASPMWNARNDDLPFSGNIDHTAIRKFLERLDISFATPASARGGIDLETIRRHRNNLAHGVERFSDVGNQVTVEDLKQIYHRASVYMRAVLRKLDTYSTKGLYRRTPKKSRRKKVVTSAPSVVTPPQSGEQP